MSSSKYKELPPLPPFPQGKDTPDVSSDGIRILTPQTTSGKSYMQTTTTAKSLPLMSDTNSLGSPSTPISQQARQSYQSSSGNAMPQKFQIKSLARKPPPLLKFKSDPTDASMSLNNNTRPSILASKSTSSRIINQPAQSPVVSTISINNNESLPSFLESKSLKRKNIKQLTLTPQSSEIVISEPPTSTTSDLYSSSQTGSSDNFIPFKDPDKKASTDELIANIQNLELGIEYQLPIRAEDLVLLKKLGSGNSGTVSKVLHLPTQKAMARKIIHVETKEVIQSQIIRELRIMHECDSPFIIGFFGSFLHEGDVVICMEYVDCGSLDKIFNLTGPFPEFILRHVAYSVLSGLNYLYDNHRIIHRDVKPSNVLLDSKGNMKLCDFGVSRELINSMADTFVGTSTYMSPERIQGGVYSVKGDVWSLGLMLYELASGKFAFNSNSGDMIQKGGPDSILDLLQRIVNEKPPSLSPDDGFSPELCEFIDLCLKKERLRSDPHELMKHAFLKGFIEDENTMLISSNYRSDIKRWAKNVRRVQKGKPMKG